MKKRQKRNLSPFDKYFGKYSLWITLFLSLFLGAYIYQDFLTFEKLFYFKDIGSDTINNHYVRLLNKQYYGTAPYDFENWSFYKGMGEPLTQNGYQLPTIKSFTQSFSQLFGFLHSDFHYYEVAYWQWITMICCALLCFFYFRVMAFSNYSAIVGALVLSFCGWAVIGGSWHSHIPGVMKCVFVLLSFELFFKKKHWIAFPISIYCLTIPEVYFYAEFLILYATVRFLSVKGSNLKGWVSFGVVMILLAFVGILFKAPNLFYSITQITEMPRVGGSSSMVNQLSSIPIFTLESPIHYFTVLMRTFSNDLLGNGSQFKGWYNYLEAPAFYCGLSILLLIPQIFVSLNNRQRLLYASFLLFWLLIIIFPFFRYGFYKFAGNYYKAALSLFIPVTLIFMGIQALSRLDKKRVLNKWLLLATLFFLLVLLHYPYSSKLQSRLDTSLQTTITLLLVLEAVCIYLLSLQKWRKFAYIGLLTLICLEIGYLNHKTISQRRALETTEVQEKKGYNDFTVEAIAYLKSIDQSFYRCTKDYTSSLATHASLNDAQGQGYYGTSSYSSLNTKYYINFLQAVEAIGKKDQDTRWAAGVRGQSVLQSLCGVKYALSKGNSKRFEQAGYRLINQFNDVKVLQNTLALPLGFAYEHYILYKDYKKLNKFQKSIALLKAVVVTEDQLANVQKLNPYPVSNLVNTPEEYSTYGSDIENLKQYVLNISEHENNTIGGNITLDKPMMVFYSIPYHAGWKAYIDKKEVPITILDMGLIGVMVESGSHELDIQFVPKFTIAGNILFFIVLITYLLAIWWYYGDKSANKNLLLIILLIIPIITFLQFPFWEILFLFIVFFCWIGLFQSPYLLKRFNLN